MQLHLFESKFEEIGSFFPSRPVSLEKDIGFSGHKIDEFLKTRDEMHSRYEKG
jgi:hypothetical protein